MTNLFGAVLPIINNYYVFSFRKPNPDKPEPNRFDKVERPLRFIQCFDG